MSNIGLVPKGQVFLKQTKSPPWPLGEAVRVRFSDWKIAKNGIIQFFPTPNRYMFVWDDNSREIQPLWPVVHVEILHSGEIWTPFTK